MVDKIRKICYNVKSIMKILLCSDSYYPHTGGVAEYIHHLAVAIRKLGNKVIILAPKYTEEHRDDDFVVRIGRCILFQGNRSTLTFTYDRRLPFLVRDFLQKERFDITHTSGPLGWNLPYWVLHFSKCVNITIFHTAFTGFNFYKLAKFIFKKELEKKIHGAIVSSVVGLKTTSPHFALNYRMIPNGVDTERFNPAVKPIGGLPEGKLILFVGRLDPRKGLDRLISAFRIIKERIPSSYLIVVGVGNRDIYRKMVPHKMRESVIFKGYVPPCLLPGYYASCDLYVSPATGGETFGIVLLEAMASGIPVIGSNIPGYNEVIKDGENGMLFNPSFPSDIASKSLILLENREIREKMIKNARRYALGFSWDKIAERVVSFYEELYKKI